MSENAKKKIPFIIDSNDSLSPIQYSIIPMPFSSSSSSPSSSSSSSSSSSMTSSSSPTSMSSSLSSIPRLKDPFPYSLFSSEQTSQPIESIAPKDLESEFKKINCGDENYYSTECNKFLLKKEIAESNFLSKHPKENVYLYPNLNDKNFNIKIANKKEFNDTKYDGAIYEDVKKQADILANADFELQPHQAFVKNYMSFQTPYSSLLLYHGLGSGKTCSAIGVCEEMRDYMKQMGITKRIIIVASENVQDNFKLQLFDERKLKIVDGVWNVRACTGNKLIKEINPMNMKMPKEKIISQIKNLINSYYIFLGYEQFANYIIKTMNYTEEFEKEKNKLSQTKNAGEKSKIQTLKDIKTKLNNRIIKKLRNEFNGRLIVIDEVHNIRKTDDAKNKKVAINLELLVRSAQNLRFLLLSATPMYNSYREIIWLLNLMNVNDRRSKIAESDIFDKNGDFKKNGEEVLIRKATGYVSFVRGENPYTFPFRVYPNDFAKQHTFPAISYPTYQMNLKKIPHEDKKRILSLYLQKIGNCDNCGKCQYCVYKYVISKLRDVKSFGYTTLQTPIETLIISYPMPGLKSLLDEMPSVKYSNEMSESLSESDPFSESVESEEIDEVEELEKPEESEKVEELEKIEKPEEIVLVNENNEDEEESTHSKRFRCPKGHVQKPPRSKKCVPKNVSGGGIYNVTYKGGAIDSRMLTGKAGLERMMTFVDENSPPKKGEFEYKKTTIEEYGKIFSKELIGDYSWKIKSILDKIVDPESNVIGEGVILVYSQYIDSGLIPVALALEEMGFIRYGQDVKPLFKNKPAEVVDVRTMKPPTNKSDFMPARYSIITGDSRLSPNNVYEVKGATGEDNKDGNKVKVILISKAGSEGIDFKFIRQVHILEPWYNMNRIEQIIGRAVRNFSHKDLVFEKRNVEIFMYGTILEDNKEESADLYVYRLAEYKAIQMGKVSRVLKESAIDCIINHGQTNFTQEIISKTLKEPITQILSNGTILRDFKIGDAPFSPACDYMANCNYDCHPNKKINPDELNEDTYDEKFITINSERILQRIRMLMKESFFYKKDTLLKSIRAVKEYPYVQIYSALTQLIEDKNEFIVDKYGRNGRLINIGDYYLFQPVELRDKNASIFDRSAPIDLKHSSINFEIKQDIVKPVIDKRNLDEHILHEESALFSEGKKIIDEMNVNLNVSKEYTKQTKVSRGDDNWYKHCGIVMKKFVKEYPETRGDMIIQFLIDHMLESLLYDDKIEVINYLYSLDTIKSGTIEWFSKEYFDKNMIVTKNLKALVMYKLNKRIIVILNENNKWVQAEPEDERELAMSTEGKEALTFKVNDYNKIIGFIGYEKSNRYLVFKTKDMESKRDTGARCDEAGKDKTMKKINEIIGEVKYTNETTKAQKNANGTVIKESVSHIELCVTQEFILRYFDAVKKDNKKWFLTPEMAIFFKLYNVVV